MELENEEWMEEPGIGKLVRRIDAIAPEDPDAANPGKRPRPSRPGLSASVG